MMLSCRPEFWGEVIGWCWDYFSSSVKFSVFTGGNSYFSLTMTVVARGGGNSVRHNLFGLKN